VGSAGSTGTGAGEGGSGGASGAGGDEGDAMPGTGGAIGDGGAAMGGSSAGGSSGASAGTSGSGGNGGMGGSKGGTAGGIDAGSMDRASEPIVDASPDVSMVEAGCSNPTLCALKAALVHRYTFDGSGMPVTDSIGTAHGTVVNTQLSGVGTLALAGGTADQYVKLPSGMIRSLTNATFEVWITWSGGLGWQRIFDFGDTVEAGVRGSASTTFYLTPQAAIVASFPGPAVMLAGFKRADQTDPMEVRALSTVALPTGVMSHVAVVVDTAAHQITLYRNGALDGSVAFPDSLALLNDVNNWIGRSQYSADQGFSGTLYEFRIYGTALSAASITASYMAGPDPAFLN
jgi:hypothetical protein